MELFKASRQWASRPDDERFASLQDLLNATKGYYQTARASRVPVGDLRVENFEGDVRLIGRTGLPARLTHWSFGQLCSKVQAPASYLRTLPSTLAANNLNHGLAALTRRDPTEVYSMMFHTNGTYLLRAMTSTKYTRIWNWEVAERLIRLQERGWRVPPARPAHAGQRGTRVATQADILEGGEFGLSVGVGSLIAPAGIYASDHDMFVFMVNQRFPIRDGKDVCFRGFFVENSEVGASRFRVWKFLYKHVCGNHIVWGATKLQEISVVHVGNAPERAWEGLQAKVTDYAEDSASEDEAKILRARSYQLGDDKEKVLDRLFELDILPMVKLEAAYTLAEVNEEHDGSPRSAWGMAQGITRLSQETPYADERTTIDRAAGEVLEMAF